MDPGLYAGVPMAEYHTWPGFSQSRAKVLRDRSPLHLRWELDHPSQPTPAQRLGAAVHTAVLQPELFPSHYCQEPDGSRRTNAYRDEKAALEENGFTVLTADEWQTCHSMRKAIAEHRIASRLLEGDPERSAVWDDPDAGVRCKGRFDLISSRTPSIVDFKTARDASPAEFARAAFNFGYYMQAAHYLQGAQECGLDAQHFVFVVIEKEPPFAVAVYDAEPTLLTAGAEELRPLMLLWKKCEDRQEWPGYAERAVPLLLEPWQYRKIDERVEVSR
jgi:hypothetical protein